MKTIKKKNHSNWNEKTRVGEIKVDIYRIVNKYYLPFSELNNLQKLEYDLGWTILIEEDFRPSSALSNIGGFIIWDIALSSETYGNINQLVSLYVDGGGDVRKQ